MSMFYHACEQAYLRYQTTDCSKLPKTELHTLEASYAREYPDNLSDFTAEDDECEQGEAWAAFLAGDRTRATLRTLLGVLLRVQSKYVLAGIHEAINDRLESARDLSQAWHMPGRDPDELLERARDERDRVAGWAA